MLNNWHLEYSHDLRALGETGKLNEMLDFFARIQSKQVNIWGIGALYVFAFCGREQALNMVIDRHFPKMPSDNQQLWRLLAQVAAGEPPIDGNRLSRSEDKMLAIILII